MDLQEDDPPLIHVWWNANGLFPTLPLSERLALAERVVSLLLSEGRVGLVRASWPDGPATNSDLLEAEECEAALREYTAWVPEQDGPVYYLVEATSP